MLAGISFFPGPFEAISVEAMQAMTLAGEVILRSREIRREAANAIDHTQRLQEAAHEAVNENVIKKIAQTVTLMVSARMATVETLILTSE